MIVNLLGSVFYILIMMGTALVAQHKWQGWGFRCVGNLGWLILGTYLGLWSVTVFETIFIYIDTRAFFRWRRECQ